MGYFRIWSCMSLDKSGYALTANLTSTVYGGEHEGRLITANLVLERFDKGKAKTLWSKDDVTLLNVPGTEHEVGEREEKDEQSITLTQLAMTVGNGKVKVWANEEVGHEFTPWVEIGSVHDTTYKEGLAGFEGEGITEASARYPVHMNPWNAAELNVEPEAFPSTIKAGPQATGIVRTLDEIEEGAATAAI